MDAVRKGTVVRGRMFVCEGGKLTSFSRGNMRIKRRELMCGSLKVSQIPTSLKRLHLKGVRHVTRREGEDEIVRAHQVTRSAEPIPGFFSDNLSSPVPTFLLPGQTANKQPGRWLSSKAPLTDLQRGRQVKYLQTCNSS